MTDTRNHAIDVLIVTLIEAGAFFAGVGIWFALHDAGKPVAAAILGTVVWTAITYLEHFVAQNVGWGNGLLQGFPFKLFRP